VNGRGERQTPKGKRQDAKGAKNTNTEEQHGGEEAART